MRKIKRKYLDDIGDTQRVDTLWAVNVTKGENRRKFTKQFYEFGFADSETWNLDEVMDEFLYERLMKYREVAITADDQIMLNYKGESKSLKDLIDDMINRLQWALCRPDRLNPKSEQYKVVVSNPYYVQHGVFDCYNLNHMEILKEVWEIYTVAQADLWW